MKRLAYVVVLAMAVLVLPLAAVAASVGNFTYVKGDVTITKAGKALRAGKGMPVDAGDIIIAGQRARAEVNFIDGTIMRVARDSEVRVKRYAVRGKNVDVKLGLVNGKIRNIVPKLVGRAFGKDAPSRFEVDTPTATCGVRGTDFFTSYRDGVTTATFKQGFGYAFNIKMPAQVVTVNRGQTMRIAAPTAPPVVRQATPAELSGQDTAVGDQAEQAGETGGKKEEGAAKPEALAFTPAETTPAPAPPKQAVTPPAEGTRSAVSPSAP